VQVKAHVRKMQVHLEAAIQYTLHLHDREGLPLNPLIGHYIRLGWTGSIHCVNCGKAVKKTFQDGFCFACFQSSPDASPCILRPERCEAHLGKGRDVAWEEAHHNQPHTVYLAQTGNVKVGVTRDTQIPARWIDQGAWRTVAIARVPYRQLAGRIEVELKQFLSDRTDWRKMLTDTRSDENLLAIAEELTTFLPPDLAMYVSRPFSLHEFLYPVLHYPQSVKVLDL